MKLCTLSTHTVSEGLRRDGRATANEEAEGCDTLRTCSVSECAGEDDDRAEKVYARDRVLSLCSLRMRTTLASISDDWQMSDLEDGL